MAKPPVPPKGGPRGHGPGGHGFQRPQDLKGTVSRLPEREDINDMPIEEHLIVELYSK